MDTAGTEVKNGRERSYHSSFLTKSLPLLGDTPPSADSAYNIDVSPLELDSDAQACRFFDDLDRNGDKILSKTEFVDGLLAAQIDITEVEALRLFANIAKNIDVDGSYDPTQTEFVTQENFLKQAREWRWLRSLAWIYCVRIMSDFKVKIEYDYSKTTNENYAGEPGVYTGPFADIRATRDYTWHPHYDARRQKWQDIAIKCCVGQTEIQARPWIVYTCGPMGVGKGHVFRWLSAQGLFPLEYIVHVDPDFFKQIMPEWKEYVRRDSESAGSMCHGESCYIQEIATEVAMRNRQHVWVDGSLSDGDWFLKVFNDIRKRYPHYRIAIFYISATEHTIRNRIQKRFVETGRMVPEEQIVRSLRSPEESLRKLAHCTDLIVRIANDSSIILKSVEDHSGNWHRGLAKLFGTISQQRSSFPSSLGPFYFEQTSMIGNSFISLLPDMINSKSMNKESGVHEIDDICRGSNRSVEEILASASIREVPPCELIARLKLPSEEFWSDANYHWCTVSDLSLYCDRKAVGPSSIEYGGKLIRTFATSINERCFIERVKDDTLVSNQGGGVCIISYTASEQPLKRKRIDNHDYGGDTIDIAKASELKVLSRETGDSSGISSSNSIISDSDSSYPRYVLRFHYIGGHNYGGVDPTLGSYVDIGCSNAHDHAALINALQGSINRARVLASIRLGKVEVHANELMRVAPSVAATSPNIRNVLNACGDITVTVSQLCKMRYGDEEQTIIGVPKGCTHYRWLYPTPALASTASRELDRSDPDVLLLIGGGFLYYSKNGEVVGAMALSPHRTQFTLLFSEPESLNSEDARKLHEWDRWKPVTQASLRAAGALYFAYILPSENLHTRKFPQFGCFAYLFRDPSKRVSDPRDRFFAIISDT